MCGCFGGVRCSDIALWTGLCWVVGYRPFWEIGQLRYLKVQCLGDDFLFGGFWDRVFFKSSADMGEVCDASVDLVVTFPPYFCVKDYSRDGRQETSHSEPASDDCGGITGYEDYLAALLAVWRECDRVLKPNGKLVVNAPAMLVAKSFISTHHNRDVFNVYADMERSILDGVSGMHLMDVYVWN